MVGDIKSMRMRMMMMLMMIPSFRVRIAKKKNALGFNLRNLPYLSIFNLLISRCSPKTLVFLQMVGLTLDS